MNYGQRFRVPPGTTVKLGDVDPGFKPHHEGHKEAAKEIERMREHLQRLSNDPAEQELEIRDRLKLVHPGEKVYITGDPDKK